VEENSMKHLLAVVLLCVASFTSASATELVAPVPKYSGEYGYGVSANGNTLAVIDIPYPSGTIYVYQPTTNNWNTATLAAQLTASTGARFYSVAVYGNVIIAGAPEENRSQGVVYGFVEPEGGWQNATESFVLSASNGVSGDAFGYTVAFSGKTIAVGAVSANSYEGVAYVFTEPETGWASGTQTAELIPSDGTRNSVFGSSIAVNGVFVAVGAVATGTNGDLGGVYLYQENVGGWRNSTQQAELLMPASSDCTVGRAVAIVGPTVAATLECGQGEEESAAVYLRPGATWQNTTTPNALLSVKEDLNLVAGWSLALNGNFLVVGDPLLNDGSKGFSPGGVFVYAAPQGGWENVVNATENEWIKPGTGTSQGNLKFGSSVAAESNGAVFIGAPGFTIDGDPNAGAVFIKSY
jgi:hypothetical protein